MADQIYKLQYNGRTLTYPGWNGYLQYSVLEPTPEELLDRFYPVGTYYTTMDETFDPNVSFVGTWVRDTDGRVLRDGTAVGATGGEVTHATVLSEIPSHNHVTSRLVPHQYSQSSTGTYKNDKYNEITYRSNTYGTSTDYNLKYNKLTITTTSNSSSSHNNVQKSMVCIRWHRTN